MVPSGVTVGSIKFKSTTANHTYIYLSNALKMNSSGVESNVRFRVEGLGSKIWGANEELGACYQNFQG